jgi:hypothetical protein
MNGLLTFFPVQLVQQHVFAVLKQLTRLQHLLMVTEGHALVLVDRSLI